ncbi:MAG: uracil-DNA glycosylase [Candidatus Hodarchaeota archaeon]
MSRERELNQLHDEVRNCTRCPLHSTRTNAVPGEGPVNARVMFIGEAPGAREDETGLPFVGRSGDLLTELITNAGLARNEVFITSILKSRPPKNRTPRKSEIFACMPYLKRQIEIIKPRVIVLLGGVAVSSIIGPWKLSEAHGCFYESEGLTFLITYHPAAAVRFPSLKTEMEADLAQLTKELS